VGGAHRDIAFSLQRHEARDCAYFIVGEIWCVEEVSNHHGQEAGQNCGFDSSRNKWIVGPRSLLCKWLRRRREETAWKRGRIKTSLVVVMLLLRVMTYVVFYQLFELVLCDLYLTRFDLTKDLFVDTFFMNILNK